MRAVSARPAPPVEGPGRALVATGMVMGGTLAAHGWAGGELPGVGWLIGVAALVYAASRAVFTGHVARGPMFVGLGVAQFALHGLLTALAGPSMQHMSGMPDNSVLGLDWRMALAHTVSAALTVLAWWLVAAALGRLRRLPRATTHPTASDRPVRVETPILQAVWLLLAPQRGPPVVVPSPA